MKKKEKITYVDDGRTIADMSGIGGPGFSRKSKGSTRPSFKEVWSTYWNAVKMMFLPMLTVIGGLLLIYGLMYLIFSCL